MTLRVHERPGRLGMLAEGGRRIVLIDRLAADWGVDVLTTTKVVIRAPCLRSLASRLPVAPLGRGRTMWSVGRSCAFRYRDANGRWFNDESADGYCANEWGGMNSVVQT